MNQKFWNSVYTVPQLAELFQVEETDIWTWIAMYRIAVPPYRHGNQVLFLRSWIERWIADGMPAVTGMVEHRRAINNLMSVANGNPDFSEHIPSNYPVVAMTDDGRVLTLDKEDGND